MTNLKERAYKILTSVYGNGASFREGQYEAIESVFTHKKTLVIQKTGWGKSLVYFLSTKLNREEKNGVTLVISPLLVLIENQIEAAKQFNLKSESLDSTKSQKERMEIIDNLKKNNYDLLFITPESLYSILRAHIKDIKIGMFVIDEVHCISDWGHDFRMSYRKLMDVVKQMESKVSILGTTATANDRVIKDLKEQIGDDLFVSSGPLFRDNISIIPLKLGSKENRYAWILENISALEGSGIIYCLTVSECENISAFLKENGIEAEPFHSDLSNEKSSQTIKRFYNNELKVIVATIKLGLGYDKPDISFIIHYQLPKNIVSYYQQVGRAARDKDKTPIGKAFVLMGLKDKDILDFFINSAFPSEEQMKKILQIVEDQNYAKNNGTSSESILRNTNFSNSTIEKCLKFLYFENYINKEGNYYYRNPDPSKRKYIYNGDHYSELTKIRHIETNEVLNIFETNECLSKYVVSTLDNLTYSKCGICSNCKEVSYVSPTKETTEKAVKFVKERIIRIKPKRLYKKDAVTGLAMFTGYLGENVRTHFKEKGYYISSTGNRYDKKDGWFIKVSKSGTEYLYKEPEYYQNLEGVALSKYGDEPYGSIVAECKTNKIDYPEEILNRCIEVIKMKMKETDFVGITFIPSNNNHLMDTLAAKIASTLNLKLLDLFKKTNQNSQKSMNNHHRQRENSEKSYELKNYSQINGKIILIDDMVDSGYTLAYCGKLLLSSSLRCDQVFPLALADSSTRGVEDE